jgi:hypothetical protein
MVSDAYAKTIYVLPTHIGEQIFNDVLVLDSNPMYGKVTGELIVPGAFRVPLINGEMKFFWHGTYNNFLIVAKENGKETVVEYRLFYPHDQYMKVSGKLFFEDGSQLGKVADGYRVNCQLSDWNPLPRECEYE